MDNGRTNASSSTYTTWVGFIFIFNIIVGTGALTLPGVFAKAGWLLSFIVVISLAAMSYMTVTFVIEAMACTNAIKNWQNLQVFHHNTSNMDSENDDDQSDDVTASLIPRGRSSAPQEIAEHGSAGRHTPTVCRNLEFYNLNEKFEMGEMAVLFFNDFGRIVFYLLFVIYLYGDLSIYAAAISKSLRDIICDKSNGTAGDTFRGYALADNNNNNNSSTVCWESHTLTRFNVYRLLLIGFISVVGPFVAFTVQKTKYLQIVTAIFRWIAFTFMIGIAIKLLINNGARGHPVAFNIYGLPSIFGACVYSFMCHHSLPSLLTPIRNKLHLRTLLSYDYVVICVFYIVLAMTGIFAFERLEDLYTLNFIPSKKADPSFREEVLIAIDYFLAAFPIFTLTASFPVIAITLRNNLQSLFLDMSRFDTYNLFVRRILFPICAVLPPLIITFFTENLTSLVSFTGSYAGAGIQYIIPISLIYFARKTCTTLLGNGVVNEYQSPFRSSYWLLLVLIWALLCMCLVTVNLFFISTNSEL